MTTNQATMDAALKWTARRPSEITGPKVETITCKCGSVFEWENPLDYSSDFLRPSLCESCAEKEEIERETQRKVKAEEEERQRVIDLTASTIARLRDKTPARFQATDITHAAFNRELWRKVKPWFPTDDMPFLGLVGESGASKTRIGFLLLRELLLASIGDNSKAATFDIVSGYEFADLARNQYSKQMPDSWTANNITVGELYRRRLDRMAKVGILLFDDMGKARNTPAASAELFTIIDMRHKENLATIWTANSPPEVIVQGMSEDLAGPLAGRLIECSTIITV